VGFVPKASERDTAIVPFPSPSFYFPSLYSLSRIVATVGYQ